MPQPQVIPKRLAAWFRLCGSDERGTNIVEYMAVTGIALIVVGTIVVGLVSGRFRVGQAMAGTLDNMIDSFTAGRSGQANTDTGLYPQADPPDWAPQVVRIEPGLPGPVTIEPGWPDPVMIPLARPVLALPILMGPSAP